jgi:hypothetical protein
MLYSLCSWKIDHGKAWQHLGGDLVGQTQFAYCRMKDSDLLSFNHPLDAHFAAAGLQVGLISIVWVSYW